ncbi:STAS domain-containing protein [Luteolibacter sp. Populi]|uniref:STAS domain-containing protein n=1 Tax=Luteolibacter sp. Populi TaxID=3230487 RepID=UPI0034661560
MSLENAILVGVFDGFTWIRCVGKGSFVTSPVMKECAENRIAAGERCLVIDLQACTGMDSTFMGQLASFSARLSKLGATGGVQIAGAGERNRNSLEDLGLDCLLEIDPPAALWRGHANEVRGLLEPYLLGRPPACWTGPSTCWNRTRSSPPRMRRMPASLRVSSESSKKR